MVDVPGACVLGALILFLGTELFYRIQMVALMIVDWAIRRVEEEELRQQQIDRLAAEEETLSEYMVG